MKFLTTLLLACFLAGTVLPQGEINIQAAMSIVSMHVCELREYMQSHRSEVEHYFAAHEVEFKEFSVNLYDRLRALDEYFANTQLHEKWFPGTVMVCVYDHAILAWQQIDTLSDFEHRLYNTRRIARVITDAMKGKLLAGSPLIGCFEGAERTLVSIETMLEDYPNL